MPEIQINKAEIDFHRRRKAFVILECGILVAQDGFDGSHSDLLTQSGFDEDQMRKVIQQQPRGYALNGNVYLYQGTDFKCLSSKNKDMVKSYVAFFEKNGFLKQDGKIFDGMNVGKAGDQWTPVKEIEISY